MLPLLFCTSTSIKSKKNFFTFIYSFLTFLLFLYMYIQVSNLCHFPSPNHVVRQIYQRQIPSFLSEKVYISPSGLKNNLSGYKILGWWVFSFSISHILLFPCLHDFSREVPDNSYPFSSIDQVFWVFFLLLLSRFLL